ELQAELERYRLARRGKLRGRRGDVVFELTPVERGYQDAEQLMAADPEAALAKFQALLAVYSDAAHSNWDSARNHSATELLALSRKQVERLHPLDDKMIADGQPAIHQQLDSADQLAATDRPAAKKIWRCVITLYHDKPWVQNLTDQAKSKLS